MKISPFRKGPKGSRLARKAINRRHKHALVDRLKEEERVARVRKIRTERHQENFFASRLRLVPISELCREE